ncbi:hypothetical protein F9L07_08845 [Pimelobacter simplex]|uniref:Uncharacterized protein n=1 Tax=Nocardioides simplex TaxID=2045 RepID=A0A7J5E1U3_NOCSI|nr:hypothetical protein F9L07_08845 [Pimelobacter simplex]
MRRFTDRPPRSHAHVRPRHLPVRRRAAPRAARRLVHGPGHGRERGRRHRVQRAHPRRLAG